jgi:fluoride ion exporter CrcB/FEX
MSGLSGVAGLGGASGTVLTVLVTLLAGGLGAVVRAAAVERAPRAGTALVNVAGTLLLALVLLARARGMLGDAGAVVLGVGLSGSLTTFSGWMAVVADGLTLRPLRTVLLDLLLPLLTAVALTVMVFAVLA